MKKKVERKQTLALQRDGKRQVRIGKTSSRQTLRYGESGEETPTLPDKLVDRQTPKWTAMDASLLEGWIEGEEEAKTEEEGGMAVDEGAY